MAQARAAKLPTTKVHQARAASLSLARGMVASHQQVDGPGRLQQARSPGEESIWNPNPDIQGEDMNKNMAKKRNRSSFFERF